MKLTPEHIENQIASEQYLSSIDTGASLGTLTICVLTLKNGILITGTSACLDAANFDAQIGKDLARKDAVRQIWQLEGYAAATLSKLEGYKASLVTITVDAKAAMAECKAASDEVKAFCADAVATVTELTKLPNGEQASTVREGYDIGHYYGFRDGFKGAVALYPSQRILEIEAAIQTHLNAEPLQTIPGHFFKRPVPHLTCADGVTLSIQASEGHYCTPRVNSGPYTAVEVGFPSVRPSEAMMEYCEDGENPTNTVYGYVPMGVVIDFILEHGGLAPNEAIKVGGTD